MFRRSKRGRPERITRQIGNVVAKSSVPFSPHDLRRTFASIVSRLGDRLSYYTTKRLLNHRTSDVTQGYIQFDIEQLRCAMRAVEDFVLQQVGSSAQLTVIAKAQKSSGYTSMPNKSIRRRHLEITRRPIRA